MGPGEIGVGFHGKLPSAGDFVQRRLPPAFVTIWDRCFEHAVAESRRRLGDGWNTAYRASPVWRLLLSAGVVGPTPWAGVIGPGVDRVGRCFPLVIVRNLGADPQLPMRVLAMSDWFDSAEDLLRRGLAGAMPVDTFDREVAALERHFGRLPDAWSRVQAVDLRSDRHWRLALPAAEAAGAGLLQTAWRRAIEGGSAALWWTRGAQRLPPSLMITAGLPDAGAYSAFLDAAAAAPEWQTCGDYAPPPAATFPAAVPAPSPAPTPVAATAASVSAEGGMPSPVRVVDVLSELFPDLDSGALAASVDPEATLPGLRRPEPAPARIAEAATATACARLQSSDGALTLIAADAGGRDPRQRAAHEIADALADLGPDAIGTSLDQLRQRLLELHQQLRLAGDDLLDPLHADCAVAVATVGAGRAGVLVVGAAQAFLWQDAQLLPLATSAAPAVAAGDAPGDDLDDLLFGTGASAAPAGLGGERAPGIDRLDHPVRPGDRLLLLATPTLTALPPARLAEALALPTTIDAEARIAAAAGLPADISAWPFAVIEVPHS